MMATDCEGWGEGQETVSRAICDEVFVQKGNAAGVSLLLIMDMCLKEFQFNRFVTSFLHTYIFTLNWFEFTYFN